MKHMQTTLCDQESYQYGDILIKPITTEGQIFSNFRHVAKVIILQYE
jgi:hypothetical protein